VKVSEIHSVELLLRNLSFSDGIVRMITPCFLLSELLLEFLQLLISVDLLLAEVLQILYF